MSCSNIFHKVVLSPSITAESMQITNWVMNLRYQMDLQSFFSFSFWLAAGSAVMEAGAEYGIKIHSWDHTWMLWIPWESRTWLCSFSNRSQLVDKDIAILDDVLRSIYCTVLGLEKIIVAYKGLMLCHPLSNLWGTNGIFFLIIQKHAKLNFFSLHIQGWSNYHCAFNKDMPASLGMNFRAGSHYLRYNWNISLIPGNTSKGTARFHETLRCSRVRFFIFCIFWILGLFNLPHTIISIKKSARLLQLEEWGNYAAYSTERHKQGWKVDTIRHINTA